MTATAAAMNERPGAGRRPIVTGPPAPERSAPNRSSILSAHAADLTRLVRVIGLTMVISLHVPPIHPALLGQPPEARPSEALQEEALQEETPVPGEQWPGGQWPEQIRQAARRWSSPEGQPPVVATIGVRYPRHQPRSDRPADVPAGTAGELSNQRPAGGGIDPDGPDHWTMATVVAADSTPVRLLTTYHGLGLPLESSDPTPQFEARIGGIASSWPARLVGADPWSDLAVLEPVTDPSVELAVTGGQTTAIAALQGAGIELEDAGPLQLGEPVVVLGNPLAWIQSGRPTAAIGWVANVQRGPAENPRRMSGSESYASRYQLGQLTELDVRLSGLGSGSPVVDRNGRLRGITTTAAVVAGYDPAAAYAIPVDRGLLRIVAELSAGREVGYGFLGLRPDQVTTQPGDGKESSGVRVVSVLAGTPAHQAGLRDGDVVTRLGGVAIESPQQLEWQAASHAPGERVELEVARPGGLLRRERSVVLQVRLSKKPRVNDPPAVVTAPARSWRGVQVDYITAAADFDRHLAAMERGVMVMVVDVQPESAAATAGLEPGDLIVELDGESVATPEEFLDRAESLTGPVPIQLSDGRELAVP